MRVLWLSMPPSTRRERLLKMYADDLRAYKESNQQTAWLMKYRFMGEAVCREAFLRLTGIGSSSLCTARDGASKGCQSSLSREELQLRRSILNTNKENLYLDARQWLEHFADTHGDASPIDCLTFLPSGRRSFPLGMLKMAMVNDFHYWGIRTCRAALPPMQPHNGDTVSLPQQMSRHTDDGADDELDLNKWHRDIVEPLHKRMSDDDVAKELAFCEVLINWNPFSEPDARVVEAINNVASVTPPQHEGQRLCLRHSVFQQLEYETEHADRLPECMRNHAVARYKLRTNRLTSTNALKHHAWATLRAPDVETLRDDLEKPCCGHACLQVFHDQPTIVRNWRVLWLSMPPSTRRERLLKMYADDLRAYKESNQQTAWLMKYRFMGEAVCREAFLRLTGIGSSSLCTARDGASKGCQSSLSREELQLRRSILNTNKENLYLDARQWLEHFADTHGDASPIDCLTFLPSGRRSFYHNQYVFQRTQQNRPYCKLSVFTEAWRVDVFWLVILHSVCQFSKCGTCEYLK